MKLEWKTCNVESSSWHHVYFNTPTSVIIYTSNAKMGYSVDGCNLTEEGEFIPAPGFEKLALDVVISDVDDMPADKKCEDVET